MTYIDIAYVSHRPGMGSHVRVTDRFDYNKALCEGTVSMIDACHIDTEDEDGKATSAFTINSIAVDTVDGQTRVFAHDVDDVCVRVLDGPYYVNLYLVEQAYGGPEEGGWYYHAGTPADCYRFNDYDTARAWEHGEEAAKVLRDLNDGRRPLHSVLSTGRYEFRLETHMPIRFPATRPHYC